MLYLPVQFIHSTSTYWVLTIGLTLSTCWIHNSKRNKSLSEPLSDSLVNPVHKIKFKVRHWKCFWLKLTENPPYCITGFISSKSKKSRGKLLLAFIWPFLHKVTRYLLRSSITSAFESRKKEETNHIFLFKLRQQKLSYKHSHLLPAPAVFHLASNWP